jgi:hypothetical protein
MKTTKSPLALAKTALAVGKDSLEPYAHRYSPHKFTQPQIFALLVLRQHLRVDYRGLIGMLEDWPTLVEALELKSIPHYSTLCYAERRLLKKTPLPDFSIPQ